MAEALGSNFTLLLANHGVTFCGTSIEHATCMGVFIEKACKAQLTISASNLSWDAPDSEVEAERRGQIMSPTHVSHSWNYFCRKLDWFSSRTHGNNPMIFSS